MKFGVMALSLMFLALVATRGYSAQKYFRVAQRGGVWWLVNPAGQLTLSVGVDNISYRGDVIHGTTIHPYHENISKLYPSQDAWVASVLARLRLWDFNTIGAWSDRSLWSRGMPYTIILDIGARSGANWLKGVPLDVYNSRFPSTARQIAQRECAPRAHDPELIGYFSDNELRWGPDWRGKETMLAMYLNLPPGAPGRQHAIDFLKKRYDGRVQRLNHAWGVHADRFESVPSAADAKAYQDDSAAFLGMVARRYFEVCSRAIHQADPNHLYLGAKFAGLPPDPVLKAAQIADVASADIYTFDPRPMVKHMYELSHRPVLVAEFAFRATDSGLPNTKGAGPKVPDQAARARAYQNYVNWLESLPETIGYHWFEWCDEPKQGRFDGENSNYGLVNIEDQPYRQFVGEVKQANIQAVSVHRELMK